MEEIKKISKDTPIVMFTYRQLEEHLMAGLAERLNKIEKLAKAGIVL